MKKNVLWILGVVALILIIAGSSILYDRLVLDYKPEYFSDVTTDEEKSDTGEETNPEVYVAPDFVVTDDDGNKVNLSQMKGKPVVINFWASWCPPCKAEMPHFEEMYKKYKDQVTFMMVDMTDGYQETVEDAKSHITEKGYIFPVYYDTEFSAAIEYSVSSLPTTIFVDKEGNIVTYAKGAIDGETLERGIELIK